MSKPNILFIMADQLAASVLSFHGHNLVKTPNLSSLAENGVVFENAYCNSPLCAPSRFSMMSGQLPSAIGGYDNAAYFPADTPTLAHYLRAEGYQTSLCGKMHFVGADQLHGFEERLTTDIYPSDFGWTPDWESFDTRPSWYHNLLSVVQAGTCKTSNQLDFDEEVAFKGVRKLYDLARSSDKRPFFLLTSFTHPHDPFAITPEYWTRYDAADIDLPSVAQMLYEDLDPHSQRLHHVCALGDYEQTDERIRRARHAYYGMISYIDDKVGELIKALKATHQLDNTIIIFTSDHGEMLGERGLWYKMSFFEHSAHVPLLFYAPERFQANRIKDPVSLIDLLPTLADLATEKEVDYAAPIEGSSLLPLMRGESPEPERSVYGEMLGEGAIAPVLMIRRGAYKYIYSQPDPEQLYDLENDPHELRNLASVPEFATTVEAFRSELKHKWNVERLHQDVLASQRRRHLVDSALREGKHTPWDFRPFRDASEQFMRNHLDLNVLEKSSRFPTPDTPEPDQ